MSALAMACAMSHVAPEAPGFQWTAVCVWCLEKADPHQMHPARRYTGSSDCTRCPVTGPDTFVALLPIGVR